MSGSSDNEKPQSNEVPGPGIPRALRIYWGIFAALPIIAAALVAPAWAGKHVGSACEQLLLGWIYFPLRAVPQMTVDWPTVLLGAASAAAFVFGLHRLLGWFTGRGSAGDKASARRWPMRATLVL